VRQQLRALVLCVLLHNIRTLFLRAGTCNFLQGVTFGITSLFGLNKGTRASFGTAFLDENNSPAVT
jgi:hypothetical protein